MIRIMYLAITMMCLAVTLLIGFHLGNRAAEAQGTGAVVAIESATGRGGNFWAITDNGDVYHVDPCCPFGSQWFGNVLTGVQSGADLNVEPTTWGALKDRYNKDD